jgi:hypothetical protein
LIGLSYIEAIPVGGDENDDMSRKKFASLWLNDAALFMTDTVLDSQLKKLGSSQTDLASSMEADALPHLRLGAFKLSASLVDAARVDSAAARAWLAKAPEDPLPEIRLERFRKRPA